MMGRGDGKKPGGRALGACTSAYAVLPFTYAFPSLMGTVHSRGGLGATMIILGRKLKKLIIYSFN
jgi:hypothetical protein